MISFSFFPTDCVHNTKFECILSDLWKYQILEYLQSIIIALIENQMGLDMRKLTMLHVNNEVADQPAHLHSLISTFVICL